MYSKIKFSIDPKKDVSTFFDFLKDAKYDAGRNFKWAVLNKYPDFKEFDKKSVEKFVSKYYLENKDDIKKNFVACEKNWRKIEKKFFVLVENIFPKVKWPKGKYVAYSTMWSMYSRFLDDKTFQIPVIKKEVKKVPFIIAHEMLHFIFYEYFLNKYKKYRSHKYDFFVWHVSEIFNVIITNREEWQKVLKNEDDGYPEHRKIIKKLSKKDYDLDNLVDNIIREVSISLKKD